MSTRILTNEFKLHEYAGVFFACTAAADYHPVLETIEFKELLILSAMYCPRTGKPIPIPLDAQDKIDTADRLAVTDRLKIMDEIKQAVREQCPMSAYPAAEDRLDDEENRERERRRNCVRDAVIEAEQLLRGG